MSDTPRVNHVINTTEGALSLESRLIELACQLEKEVQAMEIIGVNSLNIIRKLEAENEVLREQNFAMNETIEKMIARLQEVVRHGYPLGPK